MMICYFRGKYILSIGFRTFQQLFRYYFAQTKTKGKILFRDENVVNVRTPDKRHNQT